MISAAPKTEKAKLKLEQALTQQDQLNEQIAKLSREMLSTETGGALWQQKASLIAGLREELTALETELPELRESAKTEDQRQREAEAAQAAKELDEQSDRDLEEVRAIVQRVNAASDALSEALFEFYKIPHAAVNRLKQTQKLAVNFSPGTSPDAMIGRCAAILDNGSTVRPMQRSELLKRENPKHPSSTPRKAVEQ